jgi:hypothetical protein
VLASSLCPQVDNLNPEYLEKALENVMDQVMGALWGLLKPSTTMRPHAIAAMQLLGKLGELELMCATVLPALALVCRLHGTCRRMRACIQHPAPESSIFYPLGLSLRLAGLVWLLHPPIWPLACHVSTELLLAVCFPVGCCCRWAQPQVHA